MRGYSKEQLAWLKQNCLNYSSYRELTENFNKIFSERKNWKSIYGTLKRHGYIETKTQNRNGVYTNEQIEYLIENLPLYSYKVVTEKFNLHFSESKTIKQIQSFCTDNGIKRNIDFPIGSERRDGKYIIVRISEPKGNGRRRDYYKMKHRVIWENDSFNCDLSNLYLTDRKVFNLMTVNGWHSLEKEQKIAALKWCELYFAMGKDIKEEKENKQVHIPMTNEERFRICPVCGKRYEVYQRRKTVSCSYKCMGILQSKKNRERREEKKNGISIKTEENTHERNASKD